MLDENSESIGAHHEAIRREYRRQAEIWGRTAIDEHLAWVVGQLDLDPGWHVVDVAAGTGLFGRAIAPRVAAVTAVDLTPEMLEWGRVRAREDGIANIRFEQGAAEQLPLPSESADAVVTRYSIHHFRNPALVLREIARVCRTGGRLVIVDMVADENAAIAARHNELERLADPTHTTILSPRTLVAEVVDAGFGLDRYLSRDVEKIFDEWQAQLPGDSPERQTIRRALEDEIAGRGETGLRPFRRDGVLMFRHTWGVVMARKRPRPT